MTQSAGAANVPPATSRLAQFASTLQWESIPPDVVAHAKLCVLDALGCCLFGSGLPATRILIETIVDQGGASQASIWGTPHRTSVSHAALANCAAGHSFELDDLHTAGLLHATTLAVPAALALAERNDCSGRELLAACIAGFETGLRVGMAGTHGLFNRGFHPQGTSGVFCSAAAAARMLGLDAGKTANALGIGASMACGLMAAQEGAMTKRFHSGHAGQSGVMAALLAARGYTGMPDALERADGGFLDVYSENPAPELLLAGLGETWETLAIGFKAYPTVSCIHGPLAMLDELMRASELRADDIAAIEVACSTFTYRHTVWPYRASGLTEAQMNLFYGMSVMAVRRTVFVEAFDEARLADPAVLAFVPKVRAKIDPAIDARGPRYRDAVRLHVATRDGRALKAERLWRPGSPEDPLGRDALIAKFRALTAGRWPDAKASRIVECIDALDRAPSVKPLIACLREN